MDTVPHHQWIAEAAYFKAEARHFTPGKALDDWLAAEEDYARMKIADYLASAQEDSGITIAGLQRLAALLGIPEPENMTDKIQLIQAIQTITHHMPCFRENIGRCGEDVCDWKTECKKIIAEWCR